MRFEPVTYESGRIARDSAEGTHSGCERETLNHPVHKLFTATETAYSQVYFDNTIQCMSYGMT
jgi:hypothetical protein